ncbi:MAG: ACP S-malonyltransferase [Actinomycetota bacterium]|nr:ACP S-malonyltransferase [Actinomycetota bacterium]
MEYAVLFPGQGSQFVGMCADVRAAHRELFGDQEREILGWDLDALVNDGPEELLTETRYAQPALYAVSYALWTEFASHVSTAPLAAAGHSLGEYTALSASGALEYRDGLRLVAQRGEAMARAAALEPSTMAALVGADTETAESIVARRRAAGGRLSVANINAPGQIVVAGGIDDVEWLEESARDLGARRVIRLKVAGAFHSPFMGPAAGSLAAALDSVRFRDSAFAVYANTTAAPIVDPRVTLAEQLTAPVRFQETLEQIAASGVNTFVHIGPGDVTAGLARRTVQGADVRVVSSIQEARDVARELSVQLRGPREGAS